MTKRKTSPDAGTAVAIATSQAALDGEGKVRTKVQLLPFGDPIYGRDGRGPWRLADAAHAQAVIDTTLAVQNGTELFIDYDHQSVLAVPKGGTARAAGWIKDLTVEADGIHGQVEWTAAAHQALEAGEYRYISPHFRFAQKDGRITRLVNAGLTNSPNLDLAAIASADMDADEADDDEGDTKSMKAIASALGLADDASEEEVLAAIKDMMEKSTAQSAQLAAIDTTLGEVRVTVGLAADADVAAIAAALAEKTAAIDPAQFVPRASYDALAKTVREGAEAAAIAAVDQAVADGKVPPVQRDWALDLAKKDLASFNSFISAAVPFAASDVLNKQPEGAGKHTALTEQEAIACEMTGMSPEDFLAAKNEGTL